MISEIYQKLLSDDVQNFVLVHEKDEEEKLVLKHPTILGVPSSLIAQQIAGRRKSKYKLPTFYNTPGILFPPTLNLEQSSSEKTAFYKNKILNSLDLEFNLLIDLTGGFGIDSFFFSKLFNRVIYVEPQPMLCEIANHNHERLGSNNVEYITSYAEPFVEQLNHHADVIYVDPSRRTSGNQKVKRLADCEPNIVSLIYSLLRHTNYVLIKSSPLLDIKTGLQELTNVSVVYVIAVNGECKELLFLCDRNFKGEALIKAVNLEEEKEDVFTFHFQAEKTSNIIHTEANQYLYEPNAAILKAGAFKQVGVQFGLVKLHSNTHLYTSDVLNANFPGRIFKIKTLLKSDAKEAAKYFPDSKANIIVRNYPLAVDELKKKLKMKDGGDQYLIAATTQKKPSLYVADRVK